MAKSYGQSLKPLMLLRILWEESDEEHRLSVRQLIKKLDAYGIRAERKSVYADMELLSDAGFDIICERSRENRYYLGERILGLAELKLLSDAVAASNFVTEKKSDEIIRGLSRLLSRYEGAQIRRSVYVWGRAKNENETILYSVDTVQEAILAKKRICFRYFDYGFSPKDRTLIRRYHDHGAKREVIPQFLAWDNGNYYLLAYDPKHDGPTVFRVDHMEDVAITNRSAEREETKPDPAEFSRKTFGMYPGKEVRARFRIPERLLGVFLDQFGSELTLLESDKEVYVEASALLEISPPVIGFLFSLIRDIRILGPDELIREVQNYALAALKPSES